MLTKYTYYLGDQFQKNEIGGTFSTNEGEVHTGFWWGNLKDIDHLEDPGINWMMRLKWIFRKWDGA